MKPIPGCFTEKCPKCGTASPCVDHLEVDIGVGVQTGEHQHECPTHGIFYFPERDLASVADWNTPREAMWRDGEEP